MVQMVKKAWRRGVLSVLSKEAGRRAYKSTSAAFPVLSAQEKASDVMGIYCGKEAETLLIPSVCQSIRLSVSPAFMPLVLGRAKKWRSCGRELSKCKMSSRFLIGSCKPELRSTPGDYSLLNRILSKSS